MNLLNRLIYKEKVPRALKSLELNMLRENIAAMLAIAPQDKRKEIKNNFRQFGCLKIEMFKLVAREYNFPIPEFDTTRSIIKQ